MPISTIKGINFKSVVPAGFIAGYLMFFILKCLRRVQLEKATGETIFIGYRSISKFIRDHDGHTIEPMSIFRRVQDLVSEGMLEIIVKGERGNFGRPANGYRFLQWKAPNNSTSTTTHINSIV